MKCQIEESVLLHLPFPPIILLQRRIIYMIVKEADLWNLETFQFPLIAKYGRKMEEGYDYNVEHKFNALALKLISCFRPTGTVAVCGWFICPNSRWHPKCFNKKEWEMRNLGGNCASECFPNTVDLRMTRDPLVFGGWCLASACILPTMWPGNATGRKGRNNLTRFSPMWST